MYITYNIIKGNKYYHYEEKSRIDGKLVRTYFKYKGRLSDEQLNSKIASGISFQDREAFKNKKEIKENEILLTLENMDNIGKRYTNSIEDIEKNSFEIFDRILLDEFDSELGFGLYKAGYIDENIDESEWDEYKDELMFKAKNNDFESQEKLLTAYLYVNNDADKIYSVSKRKIAGKEYVGLEADGVNVTTSGDTIGTPSTLKYISYIDGKSIGENLNHDGSVFKIDSILAIYNRNTNKFERINYEKINELKN